MDDHAVSLPRMVAIRSQGACASQGVTLSRLIPAASSGDSRMGFPNRLISDSLPAGQEAEQMVAIAITRRELTAAELRTAAARSRDAQAARRMRKRPG
jgi:hypothetical protein